MLVRELIEVLTNEADPESEAAVYGEAADGNTASFAIKGIDPYDSVTVLVAEDEPVGG